MSSYKKRRLVLEFKKFSQEKKKLQHCVSNFHFSFDREVMIKKL